MDDNKIRGSSDSFHEVEREGSQLMAFGGAGEMQVQYSVLNKKAQTTAKDLLALYFTGQMRRFQYKLSL